MQLRMPLLDAIADESVSRLDSFTSQGVANLCWALAKVKHRTDQNVLASFEQHAVTNFPEYSSQGSSLLLWGLAQQDYVPTRLLKLLGTELQSFCGQFSPNSLAAVMGAFAKINHRDEATLQVSHYDSLYQLFTHACTKILMSSKLHSTDNHTHLCVTAKEPQNERKMKKINS